MYKLISILILLLITNPIYGQEKSGKVQVQRSSVVSPGAYIRITAPTLAIKWTARGNPVPFKGIVKSTHADTIILEVKDVSDLMHIPFGAIKKLEIPGGSTRINNIYWGAGIGLFGGIIIGAVIDKFERGRDYPCSEDAFLCIDITFTGLLAGGGLIIGAVIGGFLPPDEGWIEIPLRTINIGISPWKDNGFGLEVSVNF